MRKQVLFGAALLALGTAVVSSCSKDEVVIDNTPGVETPVEDGVQEIVLQVANTGDELTSRAGRPLYSAEAKQNIDNVFIVIVNEFGNVVKTNKITDWMQVSADYSTNGHGKQYTWKIPAAELLAEGNYKVYAIGYSNESAYQNSINFYVSAMESAAVSTGGFAKFTALLTNIDAEEFFAGEINEITVGAGGEFELTANQTANVLTLHRQVTGVTGYFINVPTTTVADRGIIMKALSETATKKDGNRAAYNTAIAGYKLRLVASNCNDQIVAAGFNSEFTTTDENVKYIVNGLQSGSFSSNITAGANFSGESDNSRYIVYEISLGDWFPNGDVNNDGILGEADANAGVNNWGKPSTMGDQTVGFQPGSVFGANFLIPFLKKAGTKTLELQLWGKAVSVSGTGETDYEISGGTGSEEILRSWNINLASDDDQLGSTSVNGNFVWTLSSPNYEPIQIEGTTMAEERTSYSLVRNHLYSVGEKGTDEWDPDTDEPEDLSKGQNLILRVNDNWELIHKMEVE
ncbi:hypothetical protein I6E10_05045 [Phocaeicola barnesiae]|uniref:hypothetical protein n=1 Tax=Phocaeicola barnesiae TaxID=376804 RepID=UPI001F260E05|nr:hypothetical protein [Phocaeicola barnesiae]MCF2598116.1 hypothetical protein [Phocaeicola barnesiae]